jgi:hypothetical protein
MRIIEDAVVDMIENVICDAIDINGGTIYDSDIISDDYIISDETIMGA